jgi:hypothetical protein
MQPDFTITHDKWNTMLWSNIVLKETDGKEFIPEINMFTWYEGKKGNFSYQPQLNMYFLPSNYTGVFTAEISAELKYKMLPIGFYANPSFDFINNWKGFYIDYGFYREDEINKNLKVESKFLMGYGNKKFYGYYSEDAPIVETATLASKIVPQEMKTIRLDIKAEYKLKNNFYVRPEICAYKNFMTEYSINHQHISFNGSVSLAKDF